LQQKICRKKCNRIGHDMTMNWNSCTEWSNSLHVLFLNLYLGDWSSHVHWEQPPRPSGRWSENNHFSAWGWNERNWTLLGNSAGSPPLVHGGSRLGEVLRKKNFWISSKIQVGITAPSSFPFLSFQTGRMKMV
jgi:hypothetical protein